MLAMVHALPLARRTAYLDYGCGSGYGTELLATYFPFALGVDLSLEAIDYARLMHTRSGARFVKRLEDYEPLPVLGFDFITCIEMIEHIEPSEVDALVRNFARLLSPDGRLVLTTPIHDPEAPPNPHHAFEFKTVEDLEGLLQRHFQEVHVENISMGIPNVMAICWGPKL